MKTAKRYPMLISLLISLKLLGHRLNAQERPSARVCKGLRDQTWSRGRAAKGQGGFTIMELAIVMLIVAVLVAVAFPEYMRMQARTKRSEAFYLIGAVQRAQTTYFLDFEEYAVYDPGLGIEELENYGLTPDSELKFYGSQVVMRDPAFAKQGYGLAAQGNLDADLTQDLVIFIYGNPGLPMNAFPEGFSIVIDDVTS